MTEYPIPAGHWRCQGCGEDWYAWVGYCKDCAWAADLEADHQAHIRDGKPTWHGCGDCVWARLTRMRSRAA